MKALYFAFILKNVKTVKVLLLLICFFFFSIMLLFVRSFHFQNTQNIIQIISGQNLLTGTQNTGEKWVCYVQSVDFIIFCLFIIAVRRGLKIPSLG